MAESIGVGDCGSRVGVDACVPCDSASVGCDYSEPPDSEHGINSVTVMPGKFHTVY